MSDTVGLFKIWYVGGRFDRINSIACVDSWSSYCSMQSCPQDDTTSTSFNGGTGVCVNQICHWVYLGIQAKL